MKAMLRLVYPLQTHLMLRCTVSLKAISPCLQTPSAKYQADKSQGLIVKWSIKILTNRAESQDSIMLSFPTGDDFISVLPCCSGGFFFSLKMKSLFHRLTITSTQ